MGGGVDTDFVFLGERRQQYGAIWDGVVRNASLEKTYLASLGGIDSSMVPFRKGVARIGSLEDTDLAFVGGA